MTHLETRLMEGEEFHFGLSSQRLTHGREDTLLLVLGAEIISWWKSNGAKPPKTVKGSS